MNRCLIAAALVMMGITVSAGELYVDQKHSEADDKNPGTEAKPFKTIPAGVNAAQPGDTIWIKAGNYEEPVDIRKPGLPNAPITISAWKDDRVQIGYRPRLLPVAADPSANSGSGGWQPIAGSKSWQIKLTNDVPEDFLVLLNDKHIVTFMTNAPPDDAKINRATYRAADRTLMFNANGKNPASLGTFAYGRRPGIATRFTFFIVEQPAAWWVIRKLEFSWGGCGMYLCGDNCTVEDCFFTHLYRGAIFLHGRTDTIRRCNVFRCGGGFGASGAGPAHLLEDNLIVECGQGPEDDILVVDIPTAAVEGSGPTVFKGNNLGMQFVHNIVADNPQGAGWYADCANVQSCRIVGNAFWDNPGGGIYNEALVHDTITQGNVFYRNGVSSSVCARWNIIDNLFFESGVTWHNQDLNPIRDAYNLLRGNAFINPKYGYLSDYAAGYAQTAFPEAFRHCMVDYNRIWAAPDAVLINDGGEGRKYKTIEELRKEFGWDLHGEVRPYDQAANTVESVAKAMGGSIVTFRIPWGKHSADARPMLANAQIMARWPGAPVSVDAGGAPTFFWRVADGLYDPTPLWGGYGPFAYHEFWQPTCCVGDTSGQRMGCRWYTDAEAKYPDNLEEKTPCRKGLLPQWSMRTSYGSGNFWLAMEGVEPGKMLPQGAGYWSPFLGAAPGAKVTLSLKLRGTGLVSGAKGSPAVWVQFTNETGQHRKRLFLVGKDDTGVVHRPELINGDYAWTNIEETVTAPDDAVRMALFFGLLPCQGKVEFDDITIHTASEAGQAVAQVLPPRLPMPRFKSTFQVDLTKLMNHGLADEVERDGKGGWDDQGPASDMHEVKTGERDFGGVKFNILAGPNNALVLNFPPAGEPKRVTIPVGRKVDTLFFLHGVCGYASGAEWFRYTLRYADGKDAPIVVGPNNLAGWISDPVARFPYEEGTFTTVAETVRVAKYGRGSLYRMEWSAPLERRGVELKEIEFAVTNGAVPVVVAITGVMEW
jgi:hypothetical protein